MEKKAYRRALALLEANVGDEMVALDERTGTCFGFNAVASDIWRRLISPKTFEQLRAELVTDYEVTTEQCSLELQELLDDMIAQGLVKETG